MILPSKAHEFLRDDLNAAYGEQYDPEFPSRRFGIWRFQDACYFRKNGAVQAYLRALSKKLVPLTK